MNCKNCISKLRQNDNFCKECGSKIIRERITIKGLNTNVLVALGWESNFFITLRYLLYKPQIVFKEYIGGTRKKYANPFAFYAISLAISLFIFSHYSEQFIQMTSDMNLHQKGLESTSTVQYEFTKTVMEIHMKYYNVVSFLALPLYTLIAFLVFRKPYNYGEHLIINTYVVSITTFTGVLLFIISLIFGINIFGLGISLVTFIYYSIAYKKLYNLTFSQLIIKILKFLGILIIVSILFILLVVVFKIIQNSK